MKSEDYTAEDDSVAQETFAKAAWAEFQQVVKQVALQQRQARVLSLRQMGRHKRLELKNKKK